jgi:hypothetical protein
MNSREITRQALAHRAGRLPIDFGSTPVSGIHVSVVAALRGHFGLGGGPVRVIEPGQMLGEIADDLRAALGVDCIGITPRNTGYGFPLHEGGWREWRAPWGQVVLVPGGFQTRTDPNGDVFVHPAGDTTAPVSAHMPASGYFFDTISRQEPIDEDRLDPEDNLEEYKPLSDADIAYWESRVPEMRASPRAVVANMGGTSFGDIGRVPAPQLRHPKGIRDVSEWYISIATRRDYVHAVFERQCEVALKNLERFHAITGDAIDVFYVCATDFGTQSSQFCSVATFEELYLPYYKRVNDWIHARTPWKTFKHSCGAIDPLLPSLIKAGFDIMNPVQCSAVGMEPGHLKEAYGRDVVFWGGGVDTQKTLPYGTPSQVREEVLSRCKSLGRDGGFVFNTIHNVQALTPTENFIAMIEAVREYNAAGS